MENYFKLIRISNWLKNLLVAAPLVFSLNLFHIEAAIRTFWAVIAFCFCSSAVYILNDFVDRESDRFHPQKRDRMLASGKIREKQAWCVFTGLIFAYGILCVFLPTVFFYVTCGYITLNVSYTLFLKRLYLIESLIVASSYILRVLAGCVTINVLPSKWIPVVTFFLALFLTFSKRKSEIRVLGAVAPKHWSVLAYYSIELLEKYVLICGTITLMGYLLYTMDPEVVAVLKTDKLVYSTIFVAVGIFRFMQLGEAEHPKGETDPTDFIIKDLFVQIIILIWTLYVILVIYF